MLLVQTPNGTVTLPPQGFFQQQPSPFASQLTPTGLPLPRPPVSLAPRIPAPADIDSASLVQPPPPPPATIPSSSSFNTRRRGFDGAADDPFEGAPESNPANPNSIDPATAFSVPAGLAFGGLGALGGKVAGNVISALTAPPGALNQVNPFSLALNILSPFGIFGESIHTQTQPFKQAVQVLENEFQIEKENQARRNFNSRFTRNFGPEAAPTFSVTSPTFGVVDPQVLGIPEAGDTEGGGFSGMGEGFGENAANTGQEDADDDSPSPSGGGGGSGSGSGGGGSFICTAAWDTGISAPETWSLNRRFGVWIRRNDPLAYKGYSVFGPWIADRIRDGKLRWIGKLKPQCWAYEMAQRSGKDTSGYSLGVKILNRVQRVATRPLIRLLGWYVSK